MKRDPLEMGILASNAPALPKTSNVPGPNVAILGTVPAQTVSARKYYATFWRRGFSTVTRLRGHPRSSTFLPSCWIHSYLHSLGLVHAKSFPPPRRQREGYESESQLYAGAGGDLGLLPLAVGARGALGQDVVGRAGGGTRGPPKGVA